MCGEGYTLYHYRRNPERVKRSDRPTYYPVVNPEVTVFWLRNPQSSLGTLKPYITVALSNVRLCLHPTGCCAHRHVEILSH
ncbi:unnamed protein product [Boreogadus saida]